MPHFFLVPKGKANFRFEISICRIERTEAPTAPRIAVSRCPMVPRISWHHRSFSSDGRAVSWKNSFRALRQQSGQASRAQHLDTLIMATLNLLMCHGIAFGDKLIMAVYSAALK